MRPARSTVVASADGSAGYDIMGIGGEQIICDVLTRFERYQAQLNQPESALYVGSPAPT